VTPPEEGLAPEAFIELVNDRVDLVEFFSGYTTLLKAGAEWKGRCPIHDEKTGSFYVNEVKHVWHCYGCGKGGNLFTFLREKEGLDFREAADMLSDRYRLPRMGRGHGRSQEIVSKQRRLSDMHQEAAEWFGRMLRDPRGRPFQQYLKERDFTRDDVARFSLGAAPEEWEGLCNHLRQKGYKPEELVEAGLAVRSQKDQGRIYDRFRARLMIPICDVHGKVIAFGGRIIGPGEPKYLNSPETELFKKNRTLFALNLAKDAIRKKKWVAIMEGYTDVMRAHQKGITNVVAAMGTALTDEQIKELRKFAEEVILVMDSDNAGKNAAFKHAANLMRMEMPVRVMPLEQGQDPDDFLRRHETNDSAIAAFEEQLKIKGKPAMEYMLRDYADEYRLATDPQRRADIRRKAIDITRIPPKAGVQEEALARLASMLDSKPEILLAEARQQKYAPTPQQRDMPVEQQPDEGPPLDPNDRRVLMAMLGDAQLERLALKYLQPADFEHILAQRLIRELHDARERGDTSPVMSWSRLEFDPELRNFVSAMLMSVVDPPPAEVFKQMLTRYRAKAIRQERAMVKRELQDAGQAGDHDKARALLGEDMELGKTLNLLERHLWPEDQASRLLNTYNFDD